MSISLTRPGRLLTALAPAAPTSLTPRLIRYNRFPVQHVTAITSLSIRHNSTQTPQSFLKPPSKPLDPKLATMTNPEESSSSPNTPTLPNTTPASSTTPPPEFESDEYDDPPDPNEPPPTSAYARFKLLTKKYGKYALSMYLVLSTLDFSLCFILVHAAGIERIEPLLKPIKQQYRVLRYGEDEAGAMAEKDEVEKRKGELEEKEVGAGNGKGWKSGKFWAEAGLAYAIHKTALLPLRAGLTVAWTPKVVKWLAARGWIGKGGITRATKHAQGKIRNVAKTVRPE